MAVATINLSFDDDFVKQMDLNDRQRLKKLYAYGESIAAKNKFTEEDVFKEIKEYRKNK